MDVGLSTGRRKLQLPARVVRLLLAINSATGSGVGRRSTIRSDRSEFVPGCIRTANRVTKQSGPVDTDLGLNGDVLVHGDLVALRRQAEIVGPVGFHSELSRIVLVEVLSLTTNPVPSPTVNNSSSLDSIARV